MKRWFQLKQICVITKVKFNCDALICYWNFQYLHVDLEEFAFSNQLFWTSNQPLLQLKGKFSSITFSFDQEIGHDFLWHVQFLPFKNLKPNYRFENIKSVLWLKNKFKDKIGDDMLLKATSAQRPDLPKSNKISTSDSKLIRTKLGLYRGALILNTYPTKKIFK